jgi:DnaJ-class molecular chaperone
MDERSATDMAGRISQIWPRGGISTQIWEEELRRLTWTQANAALRKLKYSTKHSPSLAEFYAEYNAGSPEATHVPCERCDGGGWVQVTDERRHATHCRTPGTNVELPDDCRCHAVEPCTCSNGQARMRAWHKVTATPTTVHDAA